MTLSIITSSGSLYSGYGEAKRKPHNFALRKRQIWIQKLKKVFPFILKEHQQTE
jgi:hypothetical protein